VAGVWIFFARLGDLCTAAKIGQIIQSENRNSAGDGQFARIIEMTFKNVDKYREQSYNKRHNVQDGREIMQIQTDVTYSDFVHENIDRIRQTNLVDRKYFANPEIKRGLRNADGTGVTVGVSKICNVQGYYIQDGDRMPMEGRLTYRGISVEDLAEGFIRENRFGYEETAYLILFGSLPTAAQLQAFHSYLSEYRLLPNRFTEDMILAAPSKNIMNKVERAVLALYSYDPDPEPKDLEKELNQAMRLVARLPVVVAHAYAAKLHYFDDESLYLHRPQENLTLAENFLYSIRHDNQFTPEEAHLLDLCLVLHAEHGGGNNSAFACRVLSSSGTDLYSSIAAAVGALKGPRHGGANIKVLEMFKHIQENVRDWKDDEEIILFLEKLLRKEAGDGSGLIYGMGHAVYTLSDPRAVILKRMARGLAKKKGMLDRLELIESVERLSPEVFHRVTGQEKVMCANVDMYSGLVYEMLGIPEELCTPLFAMARIVGWCAHRIEEVYNPNKIIRPAYKVIYKKQPYVSLADR